jgi:hypothetical protein
MSGAYAFTGSEYNNMKLSLWLILPGLAITALGCTSTYHGPNVHGSMDRLPPSYWDFTTSRDTANVYGPTTQWQWPGDRNYLLPKPD